MAAEATQDNSVLHRQDSTEATFRASRRVSREQRDEHFATVAAGTDAELIDAKAGVTWRALRYRFPRYEQWCKSTGRTPLPCDGEQLRDYVRQLMAERMAPTTIAACVAAVCPVARLRGSHADRRLISEDMKASRRRHGPPRRARPALGTDVAAIWAQRKADNPRDVRDAVVFGLGFGLAARAAELVGLDLERAGSVNLGSTGVLSLEPVSIVVRWHKSKTAQARELELEIPDADMPEVRAWLVRRICPIGQTEHVRYGKCAHTEE